MKKFFTLLLFVGTFLPTFFVYGAADKSLIVNKLAGEHGFKMSFEQSSKYKFLKVPKISKGQLTFVPPKNFIWEIQGDNAGKIVSNGKKTWIYSPAEEDEDTATVLVKKGVYEGVQSIVFNPGYKESSLIKEGDFKVLKVKGSKLKGYMWAELRFTDSPDFRIDSVVFEDVEGTKVSIKSTSFDRISSGFDPSVFEFKAPKGARIITK